MIHLEIRNIHFICSNFGDRTDKKRPYTFSVTRRKTLFKFDVWVIFLFLLIVKFHELSSSIFKIFQIYTRVSIRIESHGIHSSKYYFTYIFLKESSIRPGISWQTLHPLIFVNNLFISQMIFLRF